MQENAAMHEGAERPTASAVALLPIGFVAAVVVVLALVLRGNQTGTIVVERIVLSGTTTEAGRTQHLSSWFTEVSETSADGSRERDLQANSISRPGFQQLTSAQELELYDPHDNTIFETSQAAWLHAVDAQQGVGVGNSVGTGGGTATVSSKLIFTAGRHSVFAQELLAHQYRLAGRTRIDGRRVLRLLPVHPTRLPFPHNRGRYVTSNVYYAAPGTYDPVAWITRSTLPGVEEMLAERWLSYRVVAATSKHQWLVSLTARHPGARVVTGARAYIRADQSELRTTTISSVSS
jgi:hypothetical protein